METYWVFKPDTEELVSLKSFGELHKYIDQYDSEGWFVYEDNADDHLHWGCVYDKSNIMLKGVDWFNSDESMFDSVPDKFKAAMLLVKQ